MIMPKRKIDGAPDWARFSNPYANFTLFEWARALVESFIWTGVMIFAGNYVSAAIYRFWRGAGAAVPGFLIFLAFAWLVFLALFATKVVYDLVCLAAGKKSHGKGK